MAWTLRKNVLEIEKGSNLYYLLNSLLGAYNRRTDVMERAVKLDERIREATGKLDAAGNVLQESVLQNQPKEK